MSLITDGISFGVEKVLFDISDVDEESLLHEYKIMDRLKFWIVSIDTMISPSDGKNKVYLHCSLGAGGYLPSRSIICALDFETAIVERVLSKSYPVFSLCGKNTGNPILVCAGGGIRSGIIFYDPFTFTKIKSFDWKVEKISRILVIPDHDDRGFQIFTASREYSYGTDSRVDLVHISRTKKEDACKVKHKLENVTNIHKDSSGSYVVRNFYRLKLYSDIICYAHQVSAGETREMDSSQWLSFIDMKEKRIVKRCRVPDYNGGHSTLNSLIDTKNQKEIVICGNARSSLYLFDYESGKLMTSYINSSPPIRFQTSLTVNENLGVYLFAGKYNSSHHYFCILHTHPRTEEESETFFREKRIQEEQERIRRREIEKKRKEEIKKRKEMEKKSKKQKPRRRVKKKKKRAYQKNKWGNSRGYGDGDDPTKHGEHLYHLKYTNHEIILHESIASSNQKFKDHKKKYFQYGVMKSMCWIDDDNNNIRNLGTQFLMGNDDGQLFVCDMKCSRNLRKGKGVMSEEDLDLDDRVRYVQMNSDFRLFLQESEVLCFKSFL